MLTSNSEVAPNNWLVMIKPICAHAPVAAMPRLKKSLMPIINSALLEHLQHKTKQYDRTAKNTLLTL